MTPCPTCDRPSLPVPEVEHGETEVHWRFTWQCGHSNEWRDKDTYRK